MRMHLAVTDYGNFLQNEPTPLRAFLFFYFPKRLVATFVHCCFSSPPPVLHCILALSTSDTHGLCARAETMTISEKCTEKLVDEFNYIRCNASESLATFLDYIT